MANTLLTEMLLNGGCSERQAAAFERWLEDVHPVGIGVAKLERSVQKLMMRDSALTTAALASQARVNQELESEVERLRSEFNRSLFT